jgi:hypothetical protein
MFRLAFWLVLPTLPMFLIDLAVFHDDDQVLPGSSNSLMLAIGSPINQSRSSQTKPRWDQPLA